MAPARPVLTGLEPRFITAELTLAPSTRRWPTLIPLADESLANAEREIDALWSSVLVGEARAAA